MCTERCDDDIESLPLPKGWPQTVRHAVLNVIGVVRVAMLAGREFLIQKGDVLEAHVHRLETEVALLREELRIIGFRMARITPQRRPQYSPVERMAIMELRAMRGWNKAQTARRFFVTDDTIRAWLRRINDDSLLQTQTPVNRFPEFVRYVARANQVMLPNTRQGKDCPQAGQSRDPHRKDNRRTNSQGEACRCPGTDERRYGQTMPHRREVSWAHMARGSDGSADFRRLLDQLDSQRNLCA